MGGRLEASAYAQYIGRWSRLFVPAVLAAAEIGTGDRVLDVATGSGEAAQIAIPIVGDSGLVIGADISSVMLAAAYARLSNGPFLAAVMDGQSRLVNSDMALPSLRRVADPDSPPSKG